MKTYYFHVALSSYDLLQQRVTEAFETRIILSCDSADPNDDPYVGAAHFAHTIYGNMMVTRVTRVLPFPD